MSSGGGGDGEQRDELGVLIPKTGEWPVDPQEDMPISEERIWVDGCFDFAHHGHAGACLQARRLGTSLLAGIHSDAAILEHKGPTVMTLDERVASVEACRWVTRSVPHAPYVTSLPWISHYGCKYVVHGDDITSDSGGADTYRFAKQAGRFKVVKRTPGISTTDLVGRMLLCTRGHHIRSLQDVLEGKEGSGNEAERKSSGEEMRERIRDYATDESGLKPGLEVWAWKSDGANDEEARAKMQRRRSSKSSASGVSTAQPKLSDVKGSMVKMVEGKPPRPGQKLIYVDGGFDLFSTGHIEFLKTVLQMEEDEGRKKGWYNDSAKQKRVQDTGEDYGPAYIIAGVHDDETINYWKGINYPIMNIFERGLCVLQCAYVHAVLFNAPFSLPSSFLKSIPYGQPQAIYHGPTSFMPATYDPYADARSLGIFKETPMHEYAHVNAAEIVDRILKSRARYEERQRAKGVKGVGEEAIRRREELARKAEEEKKSREKQWKEIERQYSA